MARTGRPPKPTEQKKRQGTYRVDRDRSVGNLAPVPAAEAAPADLPPEMTLERVFEMGQAWLAQTDTLALAMLRESIEERADLRRAVLDGHGDRKQLRDLDKQIISQLSALGFDPAARSRLGLAEVKAASKLEELRARREDR